MAVKLRALRHTEVGDRRDETDVVLDDKNCGSLALEDTQQVSEPRDLFSGEANSPPCSTHGSAKAVECAFQSMILVPSRR
jgi:hypothetical protein